ncbi:hypothetical protein ACFONG_14915 [Uliginosibacterium paludis]|uniref:Uncharacterized protein n=1 Tax=Uliginosibacterium paludis TaxID=1615952 RepID=A0ABV2CVV4_9RHOO
MSLFRLIPCLFCVLLPGLSAAQAPSPLVNAVRDYAARAGGDARTQEFRHALTDLDRDGVDDALVLLFGPDWCGTGGCTLLVLHGAQDGFRFVSASRVSEEPVRVSTRDRRHGWSSLIVHSRQAGDVLLRFDGKRYPPNPSMQGRASKSQLRTSTVLIR